jgi:RNA polymerase sigma factor (sigma-70 family)
VCKQGHPLSGENVKIIRNANGTTKQRCVKCERHSNREYQRRERAKSPKARPQTLAEKIASSYDIAGDCHIWNGKLDKGHPTISHRKRYTRVRKLMYVARYGALKYVSDTAVTCGQPLCVNPAHIAGMQRELRLARAQIGARIMTCWDEIVRYARQRTHGKFDSDDIAQAAVAATYERLESGARIDNVIGFMRAAVRNAIIDQARRFTIAPMIALPDDHDTIASPTETSDPMLICEQDEYRSDRRKHYAQVLRRIGYRSKQAARVLRHRIGGLSAKQIGDKLGIAVHTVERHMTTARRIALPTEPTERSRHEPIAAVLL